MRWFAILAGFAGALLVIRPGAESMNAGALLAFGCAFAYALYQISTRIVREAEPMVSLLYGGLVGMVALSVLVPFGWSTPNAMEWLQLAGIGAIGAIGHLLLIMALRRAEASRVSPFIYLQLVWAMLSTIFVFGVYPHATTLLGAAVVVGSGLLLFRLDARERAASARRIASGQA